MAGLESNSNVSSYAVLILIKPACIHVTSIMEGGILLTLGTQLDSSSLYLTAISGMLGFVW